MFFGRRKTRRALAVVAALAAGILAAPRTVSAAPPAAHPADTVDWKLLFNRFFAMEIRKEELASHSGSVAAAAWKERLREHSYYTPSTFNQTIERVLQAGTSNKAYDARRAHYEQEANYAAIMASELAAGLPEALRRVPEVSRYLSVVERNRDRAVTADENFFASPEGQNFQDAIAFGPGGAGSQEVAFVLVPGYAAHAIKFEIFPEIVKDANHFWGRPDSRPLLAERLGIDFDFEDFRTFYGRGGVGPRPFDILHPAGRELGNTVGLNVETADLMADWLAKLPPAYANKKLILLGYSKGAPVVFEMLERHPELRSRVIGLVTYAGVIQGTHVGRTAQENVKGYLGSRTIGEFIDKVRETGADKVLYSAAPFLQGFDLSFVKMPKIQEALSALGMETSELEAQADRLMDGREVRELVDGARDLSPYTRTLWNLRHFNNDLVERDTFVFNLSAIADIKTFVRPTGFDSSGHRRHSLIAPTLDSRGKIDWKNFSLDAMFLYLSSIDGFKKAPGGLYDTQVELQHTKSPWLDRTPLTASLTADELRDLWSNEDVRAALRANGITTIEKMSSTPRSELLRQDRKDNIRAYDLGEIKGHHWSLFLQAFRPPKSESSEFYTWTFPRKPYMRALLQTMALYNLVNQLHHSPTSPWRPQ